MTTLAEFEQREKLLQELRQSNDPSAKIQADTLQKSYHDEQMALLSDDVYDAAKHEGVAPAGWIRASENLGLLREQVPQLASISDAQLRELIEPKGSGFRAEIYLPDSKILGPGYQLTVVPKGSAGQVMTANGLRDTTVEDFGSNNRPQAVGMRADYYDRGMRLTACQRPRSRLRPRRRCRALAIRRLRPDLPPCLPTCVIQRIPDMRRSRSHSMTSTGWSFVTASPPARTASNWQWQSQLRWNGAGCRCSALTWVAMAR